MKFGKTIKIFLIDGDPNGRMSCELSNWSGKAYKIPRIKIKDCTDRGDLSVRQEILILTDEQRSDIIESKKEIEKGLFIGQDELDKEITAWLNAK
jgi:hypothetical protein